MTTLYDVFVRDWWEDSPDCPGRLLPGPGEKEYIGRSLTRDNAVAMQAEYNDTHEPGRLSRKAEFENNGENVEYNGYPNYATWNVALWIDNDENWYRAMQFMIANDIGLDEDDGPVEADEVKQFVRRYLGGTTPDLDEHDVKQIDWDWLADEWEELRAELIGNLT